MSSKLFEGFYHKLQKNGETICFIPGKSAKNAFIQVITNLGSYNFDFDEIIIDEKIKIGDCVFSNDGIEICLPNIYGKIYYKSLTPIKYDIMGPFKLLPMECRHGVISMHHKLNGFIMADGRLIDFTGGTGYIEKDSGRSFPEKYIWLSCNDFNEKCSIMVSVAKIPFLKSSFWGCICVIHYKGEEYRLATYLGVKIVRADKHKILLTQGKYRLEIDIKQRVAHTLKSPINGKMQGVVKEGNAGFCVFKFYESEKLIFCLESQNASLEIML